MPLQQTVTIPGTDFTSIPLVLGGNTFGWTTDDETSFEILEAFLAGGGRIIDTADVYSAWGEGLRGGESEAMIGRWLAQRGRTDDVVVATKAGKLEGFTGNTPDVVHRAIDASRERLGLETIDLFYSHEDDGVTAIAEQVVTYDALVREGKARHLGLSNYSPERTREYLETAKREGLTVPVVVQPPYNLVDRGIEKDLLPLAQEHGLAVLSYFSLASGFLTGKYRTKADLEGRARADMAKGHLTEQGLDVVDEIVRIADARGVAPATVALAWLVAQGVDSSPVLPIASATSTTQLRDLTAVASLTLSEAEVAVLTEVSQPFA